MMACVARIFKVYASLYACSAETGNNRKFFNKKRRGPLLRVTAVKSNLRQCGISSLSLVRRSERQVSAGMTKSIIPFTAQSSLHQSE
jgi:hypothetical protein